MTTRRQQDTRNAKRRNMDEGKESSYVVPRSGTFLQGLDVLHSRQYNKGTAFTEKERMFLNLEGLLPPTIFTQDQQATRVLEELRSKASDIARYSSLMNLQNRNQKLFYHVMQNYVEELLPIVYTPTVGLACQHFGNLYKQSRGMYISIRMKGRVRQVLKNWESSTVKAIVFTDGERILGLGDLGASGMGIPIGKMALYTALGGVNPAHTLPVTIDVGTNNEKLINDPMYGGLKIPRVRGDGYDELIDEFITAARAEFGENVLLQFEDFANANAFRLLRKYQDKCCTFNDDIQGTASVVTAGVLAALPHMGLKLLEHKFLFVGAGSAGLGIANLIASAVSKATGCSEEQARGNIWCIDSRGLVFKDRKSGGLSEDKMPFAHEWKDADTLGKKVQPLELYIKTLGITGIFGVSAQGGVFTPAALKQIAANTSKPLVFALSNPTSKAECTAEEAYTHTNGKCLFASGSPFKKVTLANGETRVPGQGNNSYIFPGVALAIIATGARRVTDKMFLTAAEVLAKQVTPEDIAQGTLYPSLTRILEVSSHIASAVATDIFDANLATINRPPDMLAFCKKAMWSSKYDTFCP